MNQHSTAASTQRFFSAPLAETDPELAAAIRHELGRQQDGIELIESAGLPDAHSIGIAERGLFLDIARECREHYGSETRLYFVCGRDAAERVIGWDYGRSGMHEEMMVEFDLLVAPRGGPYEPPAQWRGKIHELRVRKEIHEVSSTDVRTRIERGEPWEHLVPVALAEKILRIYS